MKFVHWLFKGELFVMFVTARSGIGVCSPTQFLPCTTKCKSPPINGQVQCQRTERRLI